MLISIVLLNYNGEKYLENCIKSLLSVKRLRPDLIETIVCDGNSRDGSIEIINKYAFDQVYIRNDRGQSDAINFGFNKANGDWLIWLNSDDYLCLEFFENNLICFYEKKYSWISGSVIMVDDADSVLYRSLSPIKHEFCYTPYEIYSPSTFIRKEVFDKVGPFSLDLNYCMDTQYWSRMYQMGYRPKVIRDWLFKFRQHGDSKTSHAFKGDPNHEFLQEQNAIRREFKPSVLLLRRFWTYCLFAISFRSIYYRLMR